MKEEKVTFVDIQAEVRKKIAGGPISCDEFEAGMGTLNFIGFRGIKGGDIEQIIDLQTELYRVHIQTCSMFQGERRETI